MNSEHIAQLSQMVIGGQIVHKFDYIASVYINDRHYFNVYRRYNSPYNIVVEDYNNDVHFHQDYTMRTSLKKIMCLTDAANMYMCYADSFKYNGPVLVDILDMHWTNIHTQFQAVNVYLSFMPVTPPNQMIQPLIQPPPLIIPEPTINMDPSDHPSMTLKYINVSADDSCHTGCYCDYDECCTSDYTQEESNNYMILRNGRVVYRS